MKDRIGNFATKFECKFTIETGILSPELTKILNNLTLPILKPHMLDTNYTYLAMSHVTWIHFKCYI